MNKVELWKFVQVEDSRGKTCDQDVRRLVVGSSCQVVKIPLLIEEVSTRAEARENTVELQLLEAADVFINNLRVGSCRAL